MCFNGLTNYPKDKNIEGVIYYDSITICIIFAKGSEFEPRFDISV